MVLSGRPRSWSGPAGAICLIAALFLGACQDRPPPAGPTATASPVVKAPVDRPAPTVGRTATARPAESPTPRTTPVQPAIARARYAPLAAYQAVVDQVPEIRRSNLAPALVANATARNVRAPDRSANLVALAADPVAIDDALSASPNPLHLRLADLDPTAVYFNAQAARALDLRAGEAVELSIGARPTQARVRGILPADQLARPEPTVYLPLVAAQVLLGRPDQFNAVLILPGSGRAGDTAILTWPVEPAEIIAGRER